MDLLPEEIFLAMRDLPRHLPQSKYASKMPTIKPRVYITLEEEDHIHLYTLAKKQGKSVSGIASLVLSKALGRIPLSKVGPWMPEYIDVKGRYKW